MKVIDAAQSLEPTSTPERERRVINPNELTGSDVDHGHFFTAISIDPKEVVDSLRKGKSSRCQQDDEWGTQLLQDRPIKNAARWNAVETAHGTAKGAEPQTNNECDPALDTAFAAEKQDVFPTATIYKQEAVCQVTGE